MNEIIFRLAKPSDAGQIANCHWHVRERYTQGIFLSLGKGFLKEYYKIILDDPYEVVVCAERDGKIIGFSSATLDGVAQAVNLKKHKVRLAIAAMRALIFRPKLLAEVWSRYRSLSGNGSHQFIHVDGVRGEYWCWLKAEENDSKAAELDRAKARVLWDLGYRELYFEVDKNNKAVYKYHLKVNKAIPVEEITLPDGRERVLFRCPIIPSDGRRAE